MAGIINKDAFPAASIAMTGYKCQWPGISAPLRATQTGTLPGAAAEGAVISCLRKMHSRGL